MRTTVAALAAVFVGLSIPAAHGASSAAEAPVAPTFSVEPFDLQQVRLLDGPFKQAMDRNAAYLLELEPDRFLHYFRAEAGLVPRARPYGGWESPTTGAGRCLGHYLSALSLQYRATSDARFKQRVDYIVTELAACQAANGDGYLGAQADGKKFWAKLAGGDAEALKKFRVPWYVTHKLMAGLRDAYQLAGCEGARLVLVHLSDWAIRTTGHLSDRQFQSMLEQEFGGMEETLADVYAITGDRKYLDLAIRFDQKKVTDPLAARTDELDGLHANTQIAKIIGAARIYELNGDLRDAAIADYFWTEVVDRHTYANGGNSNAERFHAPGRLSDQLGVAAAETCNVYNMLKLTGHLFRWNPRVAYADYFELALYNQILASQDPSRGMFTYYQSMKPGHFKTFSSPFDSFWCCVGTGMENHTKYAQSIYFHDADSLYVNLFIPSELTWRQRGLVVRQETQYPQDGAVRVTFSCSSPLELTVKLRYPAWAGAGLALRINDKPVSVGASPGSYVSIRRQWKSGDVLDVTIPMRLRLEPTPDNPRKAAIFYGPLLLAGELGPTGVDGSLLYAKEPMDLAHVPDPSAPALAPGDRAVESWLKPVAGQTLTFRPVGVGQPSDLTLIPFYRIHDQRYTVYWDLLDWRPAGR